MTRSARLSVALAALLVLVSAAVLWLSSRSSGTARPPAAVARAEAMRDAPHDPLALARRAAAAERRSADAAVAPSAEAVEIGGARLRVRVLDDRSGAPLEGAQVRAVRHVDVEVAGFGEARYVSDVLTEAIFDAADLGGAGFVRVQRTDAEGYATLAVPAGVSLAVTAEGPDPIDGTAGVTIEALAGGERRDLALQVLTGGDGTLYGLVLDRDGRVPLSGVDVALRAGDRTTHATRTDGAGGSARAYATTTTSS